MLDIDYTKCTGCGLCEIKCPKNCIEMRENDEGFMYPKVVRPKDCINCGLCNKFCPAKQDIKPNRKEYYALQLKDKNLLDKCASGGAFTALALAIIDNGGFICGVSQSYDKLNFEIINTRKELPRLMGSKYFQCNLTAKIYQKINNISSNKYFLFSGTPCQVAAIETRYRSKFKDKLITVEIICQGAPSYKVVSKAYLEKEKIEKSKIKNHIFRSKDSYVGRDYLNKYTFSNGHIKYYVGSDDSLTKSFQNQIFLRESCYNCNFTKQNRNADFTIGDLWNYDLKNKTIDFKRGVSVVVANKMNSEILLDLCSDYAYLERINGDSVEKNIPFNRSVKRPFSRNFSYKLLNSHLSFSFATNLCCIKYNIKKYIKKIIRK